MAPANRPWIVLIAVLIAVSAIGFLPGIKGNGEDDPLVIAEPLIVTIAYGDIENAIPAPGVLRASEIAEIADLATLTVDTEVFEGDISAVKGAARVYFTTLGAGDRRWYGDGIRVNPNPVMRYNSVHYSVRFTVDNATGELFPGVMTQVFFVTSSAENVLTVPIGALKLVAANGDTRSATVDVVRPDGTIENREIVVNAEDRVNAELVSGLEAGDRVIAGTLLPEVVLIEGERDNGRRRPRDDDRFFRPPPDAPPPDTP
jgi:macrolide-specific efflux system membrane fusion protein